MEEKNKPGETVPEPGESERISAERKAALQDIDESARRGNLSGAKAGGCESTWKLKCVYELAAACMYCAFDSKHHYHYD